MDNVFVIKVSQTMNASATATATSIGKNTKYCDCMDPILKNANPDCMACGGIGFIKYPSTFSIDEKEEKRLTKADMIFEYDPLWDGEDDDFPASDIMAYFNKDESIKPGNRIMHKSKLYSVIACRVVVDVDNVQRVECALERVSG